MDSPPSPKHRAQHIFSSSGSGVEVKGSHHLLMLGVKPQQPLIDQARKSNEAVIDGKMDCLPDMLFFGSDSQLSTSGMGSVVVVRNSVKLCEPSKTIPDRCEHVKQDVKSILQDSRKVKQSAPLDGSTFPQGKMTFITKSSGMVAQGSHMCVVVNGEDDDAQTLSRLVLEPSYVGDRVAMTFSAEDSDVLMQGHNNKVFVAAQPHKPTKEEEKTTCVQDPQLPVPTTACVSESSAEETDPYNIAHAFVDTHCPVLCDSLTSYSSINTVPVSKIPWGVRRKLAILLDNEMSPVSADWRALADEFGYEYAEISYLQSRPRESPTLSLLDGLGAKSVTVGDLLEVLVKLDRKDVVTDLSDMLHQLRC